MKLVNWYGGKIRMVDIISQLIPPGYTNWYEPFCGSAAVTLNKARWDGVEVINDLDPHLINLFKVLNHPIQSNELIERLLQQRYCRDNFDLAYRAHKNNYKGLDDITRAELYYILVTHSFNSLKKNYRKGVLTRDFRDDVRFNLPQVQKRLENVRVLNMDALEVIGRVKKNRQAFIYCDPPYRHELRNGIKCYTAEMPNHVQIEMLEIIRDAKCGIMLAGYRSKDGNDLYDQMLLPYGWKHYKLLNVTKACQTKAKKDLAEEWIWVNYELPDHAKYCINIDSTNW